MAKITPETSVIFSVAAQSLSARLALCEWIDNAFDAGATSVSVTFGRAGKDRFVSCQDNGRGAVDVLSFATLGAHKKSGASKGKELGRYGVGSKDAALYFGGPRSSFNVRSVRDGQARTLVVDWDRVISSGQWEIDDPVIQDATGEQSGTRVFVTPVERRIPEGKAWDDLIDDLGYMYTPALKRGAQITIQAKTRDSSPIPLMPWRLPDLDAGHVDTVVEVAGKRARVFAGVVKAGCPNPRPGLTYVYKFRVIKPACAAGCGSRSISRIAGFVELDESWGLNKNKDGIQHDDALYAAVESALELVLRRAEQAGMQLASAAFSRAIEGVINDALVDPDAKAKRGRGEDQGTKTPKNSGRKHRRAAVDQDGATFVRERIGANLRISWNAFGSPDQLGTFSGAEVTLNTDNPFVALVQRENNVPAAVMAAVSILAANADAQMKFAFESEDGRRFAQTMGRLLSKPITADGRAVLVAAPGGA